MVDVNLRNGEFIVISYTQVRPGSFFQFNGHFSRINEADADGLGRSIISALDASNRVPIPQGLAPSQAFSPILDALGIKTYAQYAKATLSVAVELEDGMLLITPDRNLGGRRGFEPILEHRQTIADHSAGAIAAAVRDAIKKAE